MLCGRRGHGSTRQAFSSIGLTVWWASALLCRLPAVNGQLSELAGCGRQPVEWAGSRGNDPAIGRSLRSQPSQWARFARDSASRPSRPPVIRLVASLLPSCPSLARWSLAQSATRHSLATPLARVARSPGCVGARGRIDRHTDSGDRAHSQVPSRGRFASILGLTLGFGPSLVGAEASKVWWASAHCSCCGSAHRMALRFESATACTW